MNTPKKIVCFLVAFLAVACDGLFFTNTPSSDITVENSYDFDKKEENGIYTIKNLHAKGDKEYSSSTGEQPTRKVNPFVKFNFTKGEIVDKNSQDWDIAFKGTTIIINGVKDLRNLGKKDDVPRTGNVELALLKNKDKDIKFEEVKNITLKNLSFLKDGHRRGLYALSTGDGNGWYTYSHSDNMINPTSPKRVIIIKTHDNKYVKMEILGYYGNMKPNKLQRATNFRYYTFRYQFANENGSF